MNELWQASKQPTAELFYTFDGVLRYDFERAKIVAKRFAKKES